MDDILMALHPAMHRHEPRAHYYLALALKHVGPDHRVGDAGLVLDGHEYNALRRARTLAHQHDASNTHACPVAALLEIGARENACHRDACAQEAHGMGFER